jgi:Uncharacterized protein conserved in bacteria (DUF2218)
MRAGPDSLTLRVAATDPDSLQRVQDLLAADLKRFGRRDHLTVNWQGPGASMIQDGNPASSPGLARHPPDDMAAWR